MTEREEYPNSFVAADGIVHAGEKAIRLDGESDWPWLDCGLSSAYAHWVAAPPTCIWCVAQIQQDHQVVSPTSPSIGRWRGKGPWVGPRP